jgi:hypothetical protein
LDRKETIMSVYKPGSFRYAKYDEQGIGVDDPNGVAASPSSVPGDGIFVTASRTAEAGDSGALLELASGVTYTIGADAALGGGVSLAGPVTGSATLAAAGGVTLNGSTGSVSIPAGKLAAAVPRVSAPTAYLVSVQG